jgi:hypothetical protein
VPLTDAEAVFVAHVRRGEIADFTGLPARPVIRAGLIQALFFNRPFDGVPLGSIITAQGVRLRHAFIEGPLHLDDLGRPQDGLRCLVLESCVIPSTINLFSTNLARLSLKSSWVGFVNLREALIDGPFDFSDVLPALGCDCWIDARGALISGDIIGSRCELRAPPARPSDAIEPGDRRAALNLTGATVRGSLRLVQRFMASGGISLDAATISGDVWLQGGTIRQIEGNPLRAQNAQIGGIMVVRRCEVRGMVWLLGMRTGGILEIGGSQIWGEVENNDPRWMRKAVVVSDADIGASLRLHQVICHGYVDCSITRVGGDLSMRGAQLLNGDPSGRGRALDATNARIAANLHLDGARVQGRLDLAGAHIGGKMSFIGATLANRTDDRTGQAIEAINVTVGGNAEFGSQDSANPPVNRTEIEGVVNLTGAHVSGDVVFTHTRISNQSQNGSGEAIRARRLRAQGSLILSSGFEAFGATLLAGATLGRDLKCDDALLSNPARSALYAKDIEIGDDLKLQNTTIEGDLRFERAAITGSVFWDGLKLKVPRLPRHLPPDYAARRVGRFELRHARIGSSLKCLEIEFDAPFRIELTGARIATIDLSSPAGWGAKRFQEFHCPLELDGLVYDRIEFPERIPGYARDWILRARANVRWLFGPPRGSISDRLLDWVLRHGAGDRVWLDQRFLMVDLPPVAEHRFNPQPYRQLASILRSQGYESEARNISIAEQWARPHRFSVRVLYWLYGAGFGFGLRSRRAVVALICYIAVGTLGTLIAMTHDMLIVETPAISAAAYIDGAEGRRRAFVKAAEWQDAVSELPCGYMTASPQEFAWSNLPFTIADAVVFATDTVLPFIPLHLETKCEVSPEHPLLRLVRASMPWADGSLRRSHCSRSRALSGGSKLAASREAITLSFIPACSLYGVSAWNSPRPG